MKHKFNSTTFSLLATVFSVAFMSSAHATPIQVVQTSTYDKVVCDAQYTYANLPRFSPEAKPLSPGTILITNCSGNLSIKTQYVSEDAAVTAAQAYWLNSAMIQKNGIKLPIQSLLFNFQSEKGLVKSMNLEPANSATPEGYSIALALSVPTGSGPSPALPKLKEKNFLSDLMEDGVENSILFSSTAEESAKLEQLFSPIVAKQFAPLTQKDVMNASLVNKGGGGLDLSLKIATVDVKTEVDQAPLSFMLVQGHDVKLIFPKITVINTLSGELLNTQTHIKK